MTRTTRPGVSADDDPLFSGDAANYPNTRERRAALTVDDVERIADGSMWTVKP